VTLHLILPGLIVSFGPQTIILTRSRSDSQQHDDGHNEDDALSACGCIAMIAGVRCSCLLQVMATTPSLRFRYRSRKA
jgi:hypothetical protein